jgi:hypothetical protein
MHKGILSVLAAFGVAAVVALSSAPSYAKTVKECDAEYTTNKAAIKAAGQKKADYVAACRAGAATPVVTPAAAAPAAPAPAPAAAPAAAPTMAAPPPASSRRRPCEAACRRSHGSRWLLCGRPGEGALPGRHRRLGEHEVRRLPFCRHT